MEGYCRNASNKKINFPGHAGLKRMAFSSGKILFLDTPFFHLKIFAMQAPQYITDDKGNKLSVIIPIKDYEQLIEELEELEDIRLYDEAKARKEESIPFEDYLKQREAQKHG